MNTMRFDSFKVLTFDVVGTLIDFETGLLDSIRRVAGRAAEPYSDDQIFAAYKRGRERNPGRSSQAMAGVYTHVAEELGLPAESGLADAFQLDVLRWPAFADSAESLKRLRRHFRLVAMTNADRVAYTAYNETLGNPFDDSVTFDETGIAKPNPRFFAYNQGRQSAQGYKFGDILHVAQSQYHDIGVARDLGYTVCWIERRQGLEGFGGTPDPERMTEPDFHFPNMKAFADAVEADRSA